VQNDTMSECCGFNEIQSLRKRYRLILIDYHRLRELLGIDTIENLRTACHQWVEDALEIEEKAREAKWSRSIAVDYRGFTEDMKKALGHKARYPKAEGVGKEFQLKEDQVPYSPGFDTKSDTLKAENTYYWDDIAQ